MYFNNIQFLEFLGMRYVFQKRNLNHLQQNCGFIESVTRNLLRGFHNPKASK